MYNQKTICDNVSSSDPFQNKSKFESIISFFLSLIFENIDWFFFQMLKTAMKLLVNLKKEVFVRSEWFINQSILGGQTFSI